MIAKDPSPHFILSAEEKQSMLWKRLVEHWERRLDIFRKQNDSGKPELDTAFLRGQIAEIKTNLLLGADFREVN